MDAFLASTLAVTIAEIGDKTQLLSLFLVCRFAKRTPIVLGILVATLLNHALSALLGVWLAKVIPASWLPWIVAASFIGIALWLLIPDKDDSESSGLLRFGAFTATTLMFFIAEIGDKTQIATVVLAARYEETVWVILGTTAGMLLANIPIIWAGRWLMDRLPLAAARLLACALFIVLGVLTIWGAYNGISLSP
ncbi:TMEM165/GDT1 family protein [Marinobacter fonticola]|uniref:TMEM165/GDT1 family protein n=1 Tax=Marinobacter fonticola TaxID=2603215 RepID=UPI0011E79DB1|nr:TMEM165/GDT1 family protein [Marinobacter fonticola]